MTPRNRSTRTVLASAIFVIQISLVSTAATPKASDRARQSNTAVDTVDANTTDTKAPSDGARPLPDVDVRRDADSGELNALASTKSPILDTSAAVAALAATIPGGAANLRIETLPSGSAKEIIRLGGHLTEPTAGTPDAVARDFLAANAGLFGLSDADMSDLALTMNNPDRATGYTFLKYEQTAGDTRVFDSEISIAVSPRGEIAVVTAGELVPTGDVPTAAAFDQEQAIVTAFDLCGASVDRAALKPVESKQAIQDFAQYENPLGAGRAPVLAGKTLVGVQGTPRLAYRVYADKGPSEWYEVLVDATTGELLYRRNLYDDVQGTVFTQSPSHGSRTLEQFRVDTAKFPTVPSGDWSLFNLTFGNNVDAYLDADGNNDRDDVEDPNNGMAAGRAFNSQGNLTFTFQTGQDPRGFRAASITNLFFFSNVMHDWMYSLGFDESSRNFQFDNHGRGGLGADAVLAEAQDGSGTNNANFATPADGQQPRMQQFLWTMGTRTRSDDRDGAFDSDVCFHEYGHGVSNRLIGNGSGLTGSQSKAMGEGWSDYWAIAGTNDIVVGEFVKNNAQTGLRRAAYDGRTSAPNGDYSMMGNSDLGFEPHRDGEIWCQALADLRATLGGPLTDQLVLTGMKMTAVHPSMLSGRDGILAADLAMTGGANECMIWAVFARHGMGYSARGDDDHKHDAGHDTPRGCLLSSSDNGQFYTTDGHGGLSGLNGYGDWRTSWTIIVPGNFGGNSATDLLFYDGSTGYAEFYTTDGAGHISLLRAQPNWRVGWDAIIPGDFGGDSHTDLLFYDKETGSAQFYTTDGGGGIHLLRTQTGWNTGWDIIVPGNFGGDSHTDLLFYDSETGTGHFYTTDGGGGIIDLRTQTGWNTGWDMIIPGTFGGDSHTDLLFYDRESGVGSFWTTDGHGGISRLADHTNWRTTWDIIVPGEFGSDGYTDLLFYDRDTGYGEFYSTNGRGSIDTLATHADWRSNWYTIVPGSFGDDSHTDLLFYQRPS